MEHQNLKLTHKDAYLPYQLIEQLIKETDINKENIDEENSELYYPTLHGYGKIFFQNNITYDGYVRYGILDSGEEGKASKITFADGTKYEGYYN